MLAVSNSGNSFQNLGWEFPEYYSTGLIYGPAEQQQQGLVNLDSYNLFDSCGVRFHDDYDLLIQDQDIDGGRGQSLPLSLSGSGDDDDHKLGAPMVAKKRLNHNASERDRRRKINELYSSLRTLLPASDHKKKMSIPATVARVLKYIPELQKEVEDLTNKKEELLAKTSAIQAADEDERELLFISQEEIKPSKGPKVTKENKKIAICSISTDETDERELVIHISTSQRITTLPDVLLLLEKAGFLVMDVSCFQSFGGKNFYNLHLSMEGSNIVNYEKLKEKLITMIEKHY